LQSGSAIIIRVRSSQPSGGQFPDHLAEFGADTPLGRLGQPAESADNDAIDWYSMLYGAAVRE
jgi:hypothetical protein